MVRGQRRTCRRRSGVAGAALLALVLVATGCGSTVQGQQVSLPASAGGFPAQAGDGLSAPLAGDAGPGEPAPGTTVTGGFDSSGAQAPVTTRPGDGAASGQAPRAGGQPAAPAAPPPPPPASGPGFTAKELFIGVAYNSQLSEQMGAAGAAGGSTALGDQRRQVEALVKDINARDGVGGRRMVPVFFDAKGHTDPSTASQAACSAWTEDNQVFAAMTYVAEMGNDSMYACLAKRQVVFVPLAGESAATYRKFAPYLWTPAGVAVERVGPVWAQRLVALKYFSGWNTMLGRPGEEPVKVGLLLGNGARNGQPSMDDGLQRSLQAELSRQGIPVAATFSMKSIDQGSSAVLRFKEAGVTHVIGDYSIAIFTQAAESQRYRPRYGLSSFSGGIALQLFSPPAQLVGALGIGWSPQGDVDAPQDPGDVSPAEARCRQIMQDAGEPTESRLAWFAMALGCDTFTFFDTAIERSGFRPSALPAAAQALGAVPPAFTFGISYPGGRADGVTYARDVAYRDDCSCFAYLSRINHEI
jgi:hypothetical protein